MALQIDLCLSRACDALQQKSMELFGLSIARLESLRMPPADARFRSGGALKGCEGAAGGSTSSVRILRPRQRSRRLARALDHCIDFGQIVRPGMKLQITQ